MIGAQNEGSSKFLPDRKLPYKLKKGKCPSFFQEIRH